jgi:hypothetical protein
VTVAATSGIDRRQSAAVAVFGLWMVTGLFLDGWSHNQNKPETFFTPWHGVLYSGFGAAVLWFAWDGQRTRRAGGEPAPPVGGWLTGFGMGVFIAAALGDFGWHAAFGVEADIAALLSPTHQLLMTGGVLMVTGPVRAAWASREPRVQPLAQFWPVLLSVTLAIAVVCFFLMYLSPFRADNTRQPRPVGPEFDFLLEQAQIHLIASVLVTTALLVGGLLLVLRRWQPPFGTFTVMFGAVAVGMSGLDTFERLPLALCGLAGGVVADVLVMRLRPGPDAVRPARVVAGVVPVALWLPYFVVFKATYDLPWNVHMWTGTVFLAAVGGLLLSALAYPPETQPAR